MAASGLCYFKLHVLDCELFGNILHKYLKKCIGFLKSNKALLLCFSKNNAVKEIARQRSYEKQLLLM